VSAWHWAPKLATSLLPAQTDFICAVQLRSLLQVKADEQVVFERYSDSSASYVTLDSDKPQVYKTLFRAAKAKLKLRLRATIPGEQLEAPTVAPTASQEAISSHVPSLHCPSEDTLRPQSVAPVSPVIARSPSGNPPPAKFEPISPESPPKPVDAEGEAPLPRAFTTRQSKTTNVDRSIAHTNNIPRLLQQPRQCFIQCRSCIPS
jgi:next-to-BRCA1 protein 1